MTYRAVVDCREGSELVALPGATYWLPRFIPCTLSTRDTYTDAAREAIDACARSPRDCRNPRVESDQ